MDIRVVDRGSEGDIVVFTAAGRTLVDGTAVSFSHAPASNVDASVDHASGFIDGIYIGERIAANDITGELRGGEIAGLIEARDRTLPDLQSALDELAVRLRDESTPFTTRASDSPGLTAMTGSRSFADTATQAITFGGTTDTALVLFDAGGNEIGQTTVRALLDDPVATGNPLSTGDATATVDELRAALDGALGGALSARIVDGKLVLSVVDGGGRVSLFATRHRVLAVPSPRVPRSALIPTAPAEWTRTTKDSQVFSASTIFLSMARGRRRDEQASHRRSTCRADIAADPSRVTRGTVQWDASRAPAGRYVLTPGDDLAIQQMATTLSSTANLAGAGRLPATTATLSEYAETLIGDASVQAKAADEEVSFRSDLVDALKQKSDSVRGVNIDEELSDLMLYEQAYTAAARVVKVVQEMFETLDRALG